MRFDVRAESVFEFVPNNLVEFVGSNSCHRSQTQGPPSIMPSAHGRAMTLGGNNVHNIGHDTMCLRPPRPGVQWPASCG